MTIKTFYDVLEDKPLSIRMTQLIDDFYSRHGRYPGAIELGDREFETMLAINEQHGNGTESRPIHVVTYFANGRRKVLPTTVVRVEAPSYIGIRDEALDPWAE